MGSSGGLFYSSTRSGRAYSSGSGCLTTFAIAIIAIVIVAFGGFSSFGGIRGGYQSDYRGLEYTAAEKKISSKWVNYSLIF